MTALLIIGVWSVLAGGLCAAVAAASEPKAFLGDDAAYVPSPKAERALPWAAFCAGALGTSAVLALCWYVLIPLIAAGWQLLGGLL